MIEVIKFGGSCLRNRRSYLDMSKIVGSRHTYPCIIVVSAMFNETNQLDSQISSIPIGNALTRDFYLTTGETKSCAMLAGYLNAEKMAAQAVDPGAVFKCNTINGSLSSLKVERGLLLELLGKGITPVIAGFFGRDRYFSPVTFGRGGSDFSAVAIAKEMSANKLTIYKGDVDGIYSDDPKTNPSAKKYQQMTYDDVLKLSRKGARIFQCSAAILAKKWKGLIEVRSVANASAGTLIQ